MVAGVVDVLECLPHDAAHGLVAFADVALGHFEQLRFRLVEQIQYVRGLLKRLLRDDARDANQLALDVLLRNDASVGLDVSGTGHASGQRCDGLCAADLLKISQFAQGLRDRQDVNRLGCVEEVHNRGVNPTVGIAVKALWLQHVDDGVDRRLLHHHGTQHCFLQLQGLGLQLAQYIGRKGLVRIAAGSDAGNGIVGWIGFVHDWGGRR